MLASAVDILLKSCYEISDSTGRDCVNLLIQVFLQERTYRS